MNDYDKGGDICIIKKCYIMIGTQLREQSLILSALQKFVDVEREDNSVRRIDTRNNSHSNLSQVVSDHRISILKTIQTKRCLTPAQKKIY